MTQQQEADLFKTSWNVLTDPVCYNANKHHKIIFFKKLYLYVQYVSIKHLSSSIKDWHLP